MGQGTTFKVYFPQVTAELGLIKKPEPIRHDAPQGQETILVVEDDELLRTIISRALSRFGYQVLAAAHGAEALETVEHSAAAIHLLITDVVMPHLNGPELAARLTALYPEMKVLYMSGYTDNAIVHHGVLDHALWFLQKPFPITTLLQKVREVLDAPPTT